MITTDLVVDGLAQVDGIRFAPDVLRTVNKDREGYAELVESIRDRGVINPVSVTLRVDPTTQEEYLLLIDGAHRLSASRDAGMTQIPVYVRDVEDNEVLIDQIQGNVQSIQTKPAEFADAINTILLTDPTQTKAKIAKRLNRSPAWLDQILKLRQLIPTVADLVNEGKIVLSNAQALASLPEEDQEDWVERALTMSPGEFVPAVAERRKQIQKDRREGKKSQEEFQPRAVVRKLKDIQDALETGEACSILLSDDDITCETLEDAFALGLEYCIRMDAVSVREQKEEFERRKEEQKELRERNNLKRRSSKSVEARRTEERVQFELDMLREGAPADTVESKLAEFDEETKRLVDEAVEKALEAKENEEDESEESAE